MEVYAGCNGHNHVCTRVAMGTIVYVRGLQCLKIKICARFSIDNIAILSPNHRHKAHPRAP
jgi:hypothetical protein